MLMQKGLAAGKIDIPDAKCDGFIEAPIDRVRGEKFQVVIGWATGNKTVAACKIAQRAGKLKP